jgi:hypothetical protein
MAEAGVIDGELMHASPDLDADQADRFESFRESARSENQQLVMRVWRCPTAADGNPVPNAKLEFLFHTPLDAMTLEEVLTRVAGEYMTEADTQWFIRVHVSKPGERGMRFNQLFSVRRSPKSVTTLPGLPPGASGSDMAAHFAKLLADQHSRTEAMLAKLLERPNGPDPMAMFLAGQKASGDMFKEIAAAMRPSIPQTPVDMIGQLTQTLIAIEKLKDIGMLGGGAGAAAAAASGDGMADIIKAVMPIAAPFAQIVAQRLAAQGITPAQPALPNPAPPGQPQQPGAGVDAPAPAATDQPAPKKPAGLQPTQRDLEDRFMFAIKEQLAQIVQICEIAPPADNVAGTILENIPESQDALLVSFLQSPDWFERLCVIESKFSPYRDYMTQVRNAILACFEDDGTKKPNGSG